MLRFLRNALKKRRVRKSKEQHHTSSDLKKVNVELDKVSSALKAAEAELSKVSNDTHNRDD
ncbi:MAG TPA: hypothetical protein VLH08_13840, partial [Acidobacteriota bacterium]|nr:hypothetical protein [Acidobacteriota bacterium]